MESIFLSSKVVPNIFCSISFVETMEQEKKNNFKCVFLSINWFLDGKHLSYNTEGWAQNNGEDRLVKNFP